MLGRRVFYTFDGKIGGGFCRIEKGISPHICANECRPENVARAVTTSF